MKDGWEHKKLGEVCHKITDGTHATPTYTKEGVPFLSVKNLTRGFIDFSDTRFISDDEHKLLTKRCKPVRDDILYTKVGTTGIAQVVDVDEEFSIFVSVALLKVKHEIIFNRFLEHFLNSPYAREQARKRTRGMANKNLVITDIKEIEIRFPKSLPEQQRIVGILDEAFDGIATAKANAEKNLQNARALFESYLQAIFTQRGDGWFEKRLEELGTITSSKRIFKSEYVTLGVPFYRTKEIKELANGREITTELFISEARYREIKTSFGVPKKGDILLTAIGTIGEIYVVEGDDDFYFKDGNVLWLKGFTTINPHFLRYVLVSFVESLNKLAHGSAYSALPIQKLNAHRIFVPSLTEQKAIICQLDSLAAETQRLEAIYRQKLAALDELKKSLLHRAFNGEL
jgi:type I restriction enzyme S subunit